MKLTRLDREQSQLESRITGHIEEMIRAGLVDEVERLRAAGLEKNSPDAAGSIGYRETLAFLDGKLPRAGAGAGDCEEYAGAGEEAAHIDSHAGARAPGRGGGEGDGGRDFFDGAGRMVFWTRLQDEQDCRKGGGKREAEEKEYD
ncbi:MAG: hypothetical protein QM760_12920 [Nibricoccus sp.]